MFVHICCLLPLHFNLHVILMRFNSAALWYMLLLRWPVYSLLLFMCCNFWVNFVQMDKDIPSSRKNKFEIVRAKFTKSYQILLLRNFMCCRIWGYNDMCRIPFYFEHDLFLYSNHSAYLSVQQGLCGQNMWSMHTKCVQGSIFFITEEPFLARAKTF